MTLGSGEEIDAPRRRRRASTQAAAARPDRPGGARTASGLAGGQPAAVGGDREGGLRARATCRASRARSGQRRRCGSAVASSWRRRCATSTRAHDAAKYGRYPRRAVAGGDHPQPRRPAAGRRRRDVRRPARHERPGPVGATRCATAMGRPRGTVVGMSSATMAVRAGVGRAWHRPTWSSLARCITPLDLERDYGLPGAIRSTASRASTSGSRGGRCWATPRYRMPVEGCTCVARARTPVVA